MVNAIPGSAQYNPEQIGPSSSRSLSLCCVGTPDQMVAGAVDAIMSRINQSYVELMHEADKKPEIISDYKSSLYDYYKNKFTGLTFEMRRNVVEAQKMAPDCNVITKTFPSETRISVFSEKNSEFDKNQAIDKARLYIRLKVKAKDLKQEDPLDRLLSQLSKKILSKGYGNEGTFDIRLEKGCLSLEGSPWIWHYDGQIIFKTSITVCYSNKKNWSTRVADSKIESFGRPADHGFLYDALNVYHRAPIPPDLEGEELKPDDYRLFIRYNEFCTEPEKVISDRDAKEKEERIKTLSKSIPKIPEDLLKEYSPIPLLKLSDPLSDVRYVHDHLGLNLKVTPTKYSEFFPTPPPLDLTNLIVTKDNFSELFTKATTPNVLNVNNLHQTSAFFSD